ncbi:sperm equatorial segment protein 1 [Cavia porcellus]|uniref:sperm equatorial segment protein 1 n=1 Tax=Cavia porcellus TaxID=10141 RepID=UPI002FE273C0
MKSVILLVALWLWPACLPAFPASRRLTVSPSEEKNLNHYVQVLENLILSVPTRQSAQEKASKSPKHVYSPDPAVSRLKALSTLGNAAIEDGTPTSGYSSVFPGTGSTLGSDSRIPPGSRVPPQSPTAPETTAFWSIKPNNVSIVLRTKEPYVESEPEPEPELEPEPKPEPEPEQEVEHTQAMRSTTRSSTSPPDTSTHANTDSEWSTEWEDVPQLSGENFEEPVHHHSQIMNNDDILRKISDIHFQLQQAPLGDSNDPEYQEIIEGSKESLKRSLALAAAAEHTLEKMYESHVFPEGPTRKGLYGIKTVIDMLYKSRSKLSKYLDIDYIPPDMREKATIVLNTLQNILCVGQDDTQSLNRRLLRNKVKGRGYNSVAQSLPGKREVLRLKRNSNNIKYPGKMHSYTGKQAFW